jgi:hypothetical protein
MKCGDIVRGKTVEVEGRPLILYGGRQECHC